VFLSLPNAELAVARVAARVRQGGHDVPADVVNRRFAAGLTNFFGLYQDVVDGWHLYDNAVLSGHRLIAYGGPREAVEIVDTSAWDNLRGQAQ
jgi:predicted ABC-type ATPase